MFKVICKILPYMIKTTTIDERVRYGRDWIKEKLSQ
jgi:hypothetical protein